MNSIMRLSSFIYLLTSLLACQLLSLFSYHVLLQIREPFSIMSVVKSPMGLMVGFMLVVMFLMPKLMENMGKYSI